MFFKYYSRYIRLYYAWFYTTERKNSIFFLLPRSKASCFSRKVFRSGRVFVSTTVVSGRAFSRSGRVFVSTTVVSGTDFSRSGRVSVFAVGVSGEVFLFRQVEFVDVL